MRGPGNTLESGRSLHIAMVNVCDISHTLTWKQGEGLLGCSEVLYPLGFGCGKPLHVDRRTLVIQYCLLWRGKGQKAKVALLFSEECGPSASPHSLINGRPTHG